MQLSDLPFRGVARVTSATVAGLAGAADRRDPDDAVVVFPGLTTPLGSSPGAVVDDVLARLTATAIELYPAWQDMFAPRTALAALADAACRPEGMYGFLEFAPADRRAALQTALARSYGTARLAVALSVDEPIAPHLGDALSVAAQWLARGGAAVWLLGPGSAYLDRFDRVDGAPSVPEADLTTAGFRVLRFTDARILGEPRASLEIIRTVVRAADRGLVEGGAW